ncbi:protein STRICTOSIDINE SYNTHASE-LIKE 10-like isoform X1 [Coffea eugenioides]|uniref:protein STRICTOSIDINE SYNTHASE-LIKE 10-like isoform X1 n=1 Tax=Coffea eugenioides TaxID=49369 RepID=UPI000F607565|nr:protein STRICTOSIDINE SYNTHASE-LIKE 10-like isoform X1 [Coffea eugenioides]
MMNSRSLLLFPKSITYKLFLAATAAAVLVSTLVSVEPPEKLPTKDDNEHRQNQQLHPELFQIFGAAGPESLAFKKDGTGAAAATGPYAGVSDGRIIQWRGNESRWVNFAITTPDRTGCDGSHDPVEAESRCGRPLGLSFNEKSGDLYIADAYMGLLLVGSSGGLAISLAKEAQGIPFKFTNGVVVDQTSGIVYFTDSSTKFQRREYISVILRGDNSGRLMKFDPVTNKVTVLLDGLMFPNGVALSKNGDFLLVAETTNCRILKYWLEASKAGKVEPFAELPGFPDNIKRNQKGEFWVAIHSRREGVFNWILSNPWLRNFLAILPFDFTRAHSLLGDYGGHGLAVKLSENGDIIQILEDKSGETWKHSSEIAEENGYLWIGSVKLPYAVKLRVSK